jgi:hypothetical protein
MSINFLYLWQQKLQLLVNAMLIDIKSNSF